MKRTQPPVTKTPCTRCLIMMIIILVNLLFLQQTRAQCITPTPLPNGVVEAPMRCDTDSNAGSNGSVAFDDQGRFIIARQTIGVDFVGNNIIVLRFQVDGTPICCPATLAEPPGFHKLVSVAMSRDSRVVVG